MHSEQLTHALQTALAASPTPEEPDYALAILLHRASNDPDHSDASLVRLLEAIRTEPDLEVFNGYMQIVAGAGIRLEFTQLAGWLINRAKDVGADQAVAD